MRFVEEGVAKVKKSRSGSVRCLGAAKGRSERGVGHVGTMERSLSVRRAAREMKEQTCRI